MTPTVLDQVGDHAPQDVRETARDLLSRPPYRDEPDGLLTRAVGAVREWLAEVIDRVLGTVAADATLAWVVVGLGLVLLLVVVWRSTRGLTIDRAVEAAVPGGGQGRDAASWAAEADEHEQAERWDAAVRCRYVALVVTLIEDGVVEDVPGRTVGELDRELATVASELAPQVAEAGEIFGAVVYGRRRADAWHAGRVRELASVAGMTGKRAWPVRVGDGA